MCKLCQCHVKAGLRSNFQLIALSCVQNFPIPDEFENIHAFLKAVKSRPSWAPTAPVNDDAVEEGWRTKIKSKKESS